MNSSRAPAVFSLAKNGREAWPMGTENILMGAAINCRAICSTTTLVAPKAVAK